MPKMSSAAGAVNLRTRHPMARIDGFSDFLGFDTLKKARPTAPGIEFGGAVEECLAAAGATVEALVLEVPERISKRGFGSLLAQYSVLFFVQQFPPFIVASFQFSRGVNLRVG